jgi:hypothetical protein
MSPGQFNCLTARNGRRVADQSSFGTPSYHNFRKRAATIHTRRDAWRGATPSRAANRRGTRTRGTARLEKPGPNVASAKSDLPPLQPQRKLIATKSV